MKIFIIDFSADSRLEEKIPQDIEIYKENKDGGLAYKSIGEIMPDLIIVNCIKKARHGVQTAFAVKQRKKTSQIPIIFIDNNQNDQVNEIGEKITYDEVETYIQTARNTSH